MKIFLTNEDKSELEQKLSKLEEHNAEQDLQLEKQCTQQVAFKGALNEVAKQAKSLEDNIIELEKLAAAYHPFDMLFGTAKNLIDNGSSRYYMTIDTYGDNWKVSKETSPSALTLDANNQTKLRVFFGANYSYFRAMTKGYKYVFDFTAPAPGCYPLAVNVALTETGGYADIYVNDEFVRTIDTYNKIQTSKVISLGDVRLKVGEYANKIAIVPTKISGGSKVLPSIIGFSFGDTNSNNNYNGLETALDTIIEIQNKLIGGGNT